VTFFGFEGIFFVGRGTEAFVDFFGCLVDFFAVLTLALFDFFAMAQTLSPSGRSLQQQKFQGDLQLLPRRRRRRIYPRSLELFENIFSKAAGLAFRAARSAHRLPGPPFLSHLPNP